MPPPHLSEKARLERVELRLKIAAAVIGLLTAIAATLGVVVGLVAKKSDIANQQIDASQQRVQALESQNASLKKRVAELEGGTTTPPSSTSSASPTDPEPIWSGPVTITHLDLDTVPPHADTNSNNYDIEMYDDHVSLSVQYTSTAAEWKDAATTPTLSRCLTLIATQVLPSGYIFKNLPQLHLPLILCVRTFEGTVASVKVKQVTDTRLPSDVTILGRVDR